MRQFSLEPSNRRPRRYAGSWVGSSRIIIRLSRVLSGRSRRQDVAGIARTDASGRPDRGTAVGRGASYRWGQTFKRGSASSGRFAGPSKGGKKRRDSQRKPGRRPILGGLGKFLLLPAESGR
jgi:hypothetical protein